MLDASGSYRPIMTPVAWEAVPESELANWAKEHAVKLDALWALLRGEVLEIESKGESWRSWYQPTWSKSAYYRDTTGLREEREALLQEDRDNAEFMRLRHEGASKEAKAVPMFPSFKIYSSKG